MKKKYYLIVLFLALTFILPPDSKGQTPEPSIDVSTTQAVPKPTEPSVEKKLLNSQIQKLKDKIATKVAEISASSKHVVVGTIESINDSGLVINQGNKTIKATVDNEVTSYENLINPKKNITFKNLEKNDYVMMEGIMLNDEFSTKKIYLQNQYEFLTGQIIAVEKKDYTIEIVSTDQETIIVDIEKTTIQRKINEKNLKIETAGFADYKTGDRIQFVILKRGSQKGKGTGVRTVIIPDFNEKS